MRVYGSVHSCFWANPANQKLSDQAKLLAIYLLTGPHSNMLGCFRLPDGYVNEDLNWNNRITKNAFTQLANADFLIRDQQTSWVLIYEFLKWNSIQNPKQAIGIQKIFDQIPSHLCISEPLIKSLIKYGKYLSKEFLDRLSNKNIENKGYQKGTDTLYGFEHADKEQDQDQNQNQEEEQDHIQEQEKISLSGKPDIVCLKNYLNKKNEKNVWSENHKNLKSQAIEVLQFLNEKTNRSYRPVDSNLKLIIARLKSGATVVDCRQIIAKKTREWQTDTKMSEYLRPATLFNAIKFEQYMGELIIPEEEITNDAK